MKKTWVFASLLTLTLLQHEAALACAGCRNPSLPTAKASSGPVPEGDLRTGATLSGTYVHVVHSAGCADLDDCDELPVQPEYLHDQRMLPLELRLSFEYGLTDTFGVELQVPVRSVTSRIEFTTPEGEPYEPLDPDVHHRNETVAGPADPLLLGRASGLFQGVFLAVRAGISIPIGRTEEDPFALGDQGIRHQHIQLGSGTFDPVLGLDASKRWDEWGVAWFALGQAALHENRYGYRAPFRVQSEVQGSLDVGPVISLGTGAFHEAAERWQGVIRQDGSLGRTEWYASATIGWPWLDFQWFLGARVPLYRNIVAGEEPAGEFSSPVAAQLGVERVWDL
jgi:hypothetical protein